MIPNLCRPLPPLPAEVPIRSGERTSALPPAPVSPEGAAGRAEVATEVGASGSPARAESETPVKHPNLCRESGRGWVGGPVTYRQPPTCRRGWFAAQPEPPALPRALASVLRRKALDSRIDLGPFRPTTLREVPA